MKHVKLKLFFVYFISICPLIVKAQQTNTLYFIENSTVRHKLNPAFQPENHYFISLPVLGYTSFNIGNNSISLKDMVYNENGQTVTFLNENASIDRFYNKLKMNTVLRTDLQTNLFGFGFLFNSAYWTFSLTERVNGTLSIPNDVFLISLYGTPDIYNNSFNFETLQTDLTAYTEASFGFAKDISDKWSIGAKLKLLLGHANLSNTNNDFSLNAGFNSWKINIDGSANTSSPVRMDFGNNSLPTDYATPATFAEWVRPSGLGAGIDAGVEYHLNENVKLSAALLDVGFIRWNKNVVNLKYSVDYTFDGVAQINSNSNLNSYNDVWDQLINGNLLIDSVVSAFEGTSTTIRTADEYVTTTTARLNLGFEYNLFNNFIGLGLLSHSQIYKKTITRELTTSVNVRPYDWLNGALSYSLVNGTFSTFGFGVGLKFGFVNYFLAADYIPIRKVTLTLDALDDRLKGWEFPIPYNSRVFNFAVGMNLIFDSQFNDRRNRRGSYFEKNKGLFNTRNARKKNPEKNYLRSGKTNIFNPLKGLHPTKKEYDCRCNTY
jgi:hypothetical protein